MCLENPIQIDDSDEEQTATGIVLYLVILFLTRTLVLCVRNNAMLYSFYRAAWNADAV